VIATASATGAGRAHCGNVARKVEGWFSGVPLGAQYICSGHV